MNHATADTSRTRREIGYPPVISMEDGMRELEAASWNDSFVCQAQDMTPPPYR